MVSQFFIPIINYASIWFWTILDLNKPIAKADKRISKKSGGKTTFRGVRREKAQPLHNKLPENPPLWAVKTMYSTGKLVIFILEL